jgi:hypothetical protein
MRYLIAIKRNRSRIGNVVQTQGVRPRIFLLITPITPTFSVFCSTHEDRITGTVVDFVAVRSSTFNRVQQDEEI